MHICDCSGWPLSLFRELEASATECSCGCKHLALSVFRLLVSAVLRCLELTSWPPNIMVGPCARLLHNRDMVKPFQGWLCFFLATRDSKWAQRAMVGLNQVFPGLTGNLSKCSACSFINFNVFCYNATLTPLVDNMSRYSQINMRLLFDFERFSFHLFIVW